MDCMMNKIWTNSYWDLFSDYQHSFFFIIITFDMIKILGISYPFETLSSTLFTNKIIINEIYIAKRYFLSLDCLITWKKKKISFGFGENKS
jgi:hypothetical protein